MDRCMKDERTLADRLEAHAQRYERSALMAENRAARRTEGYKAANERGMARLYLSRAADLHEAAQALRSQPSVEAWRPIETAPKDGTLILTWCVHANAEFCDDAVAEGYAGPVIAKWIDHNGGGFTWHGLAGTHAHWQPLPEPPRQITALYERTGE